MKLQLQQLVLLRQELNGLSDQKTGQIFYKGLLSQEVHFKQKYHLTKLSKEVESEIEHLKTSEQELFKKHFGDNEPNESPEFFQSEEFKKFSEERFELFQEEIDFKDFEFSIEDFDFKSSESYPVFMDLFVK